MVGVDSKKTWNRTPLLLTRRDGTRMLFEDYWTFKIHTIDSFQSCDQLEDLEGKTSIQLQDKRVHFSSVYLPQIFYKVISFQIPSIGYFQSILSTRGNISIINSMQKHCKNT